MKQKQYLLLAVLSCLGCDFGPSPEPEELPSEDTSGVMQSQERLQKNAIERPGAKLEKSEMTSSDQVPSPFGPYPSAYVDEMFEQAFGDPARHSEEDRRVIRFAEEHLKTAHTTSFPAPHRFLVERRGELWVVTVMSFEALRKNGFRAPGLELFIRERKNGFVVEKTAIRT